MRSAIILVCVVACGSDSEPIAPPAAPRVIQPPLLVFDAGPPREKIVGVGRSLTLGCVVRASGNVDCWGEPVGPPHPGLRRITGVTDAVAISPTAQCVVRRGGGVACLSTERFEFEPRDNVSEVATLEHSGGDCYIDRAGAGVCKSGSDTYRTIGLTDIVEIESSGFVCVVRRSGEVLCGMFGDHGEITVAPVRGVEPARRIAFAEAGHGCAILVAGGIKCFELSEDDKHHVAIVQRDDPKQQPPVIDPRPFEGATDLFVLTEVVDHDFVIAEIEALVGGKIVRWDHGRITVLPDLVDAVQLAHGCALRASGGVACWGSNDGGALGQPTTIGRTLRPPNRVVGLADAAMLALGKGDSWAVTRDHHVFHWGHELAGWAMPVDVPADVAPIKAIVATQLGSACVLGRGDAVWCWTPDKPQFAKLHDGHIRAIDGEERTLLALKSDGSVVRTQLDPPEEHGYNLPEPPKQLSPPGPDTVALAANGWLECALARDGSVSCGHEGWHRVPGVTGVTQLVASYYACARGAGTVSCWTHDLDIEKQTDSAGAAKLATLPKLVNVTDVATSSAQTCIVHGRGTVSCWHWFHNEPEVPIASGAVDVEVGSAFGCAIMTDRTVTCWGSNFAGELGDGSIAASDRPLGVPGL